MNGPEHRLVRKTTHQQPQRDTSSHYAHCLLLALYSVEQQREIDKLGYPPQSVYAREHYAGWRKTEAQRYTDDDFARANSCLETIARHEQEQYQALVRFYRRHQGAKPHAALRLFAMMLE